MPKGNGAALFQNVILESASQARSGVCIVKTEGSNKMFEQKRRFVMKNELCVKGFSEISENEMMDVNGGFAWGVPIIISIIISILGPFVVS